jgi:hypothetical protein
VVTITPRPRFAPEERTPGTHWIGGRVGPRAGLDTPARGKIFLPLPGSNIDGPVRLAQTPLQHHTHHQVVKLGSLHLVRFPQKCFSRVQGCTVCVCGGGGGLRVDFKFPTLNVDISNSEPSTDVSGVQLALWGHRV